MKHLISSHLISSHLISSHLISSHLISSHLISSHLISSHLISSLVTITPLSAALSTAPSHIPVSINGSDLIYDSSRNLLYASVPSSAGPQYGNSIVEIDPSSGNIVGSNFAGSEPGKISLNSDNSRLYVGINGASGFRWMDPSSGNLSPINPLNGFTNSPSIAQSFAAVPGRPNEMAISLDATGSSAAGYLTLYRDSTRIIDGATLFDADQIAFASPNTLISFEDSSTGFDLISWTYDPSLETLTSTNGARLRVTRGILPQSRRGRGESRSITEPVIFLLLRHSPTSAPLRLFYG